MVGKAICTMEAKERDYLSSLPDEILHHIFSFLGDNHIVRLQGVSKRFQTICFTSPSLSLYYHPRNSDRFRFSSRNCSCKSIFNFMNSLIQHRPHALKINKLSFSSFCKRSRHGKLHKHWIEKLFQDFHVEDEFSVHHRDIQYVFKMFPRFQSMKVLKISFVSRRTVKLPKIQLASVEALHMNMVLTIDPVGEWVSQSFPNLKHLSLVNVNFDEDFMEVEQPILTICNSSLDELVISYCCQYKTVRVITENLRSFNYTICLTTICGHRVWDHEHSLEIISAPLLQGFTLKGFPELFYFEGNLKNLNLVSLTRVTNSGFDSDFSDTHHAFIQLSKALKWTTILHTDVRMLEVLFKIRETTISFDSIRHVQIRLKNVWPGYVLSDIASNFMDRLPNLETLTIISTDDCFREMCKEVHMFNDDVVRECKRVAGERVIKGLKKVEFIITYMEDSMALMIGMFKNWCVDLEEMVLNYPPHQHQSMLRYFESFDMASNLYAPVSIHFLPLGWEEKIPPTSCL